MEKATTQRLSREDTLLHFGVVSYNMGKQYLNVTWPFLNYLIFVMFILFGRNWHSNEPNAYTVYIISTFVFLSHELNIYITCLHHIY